MSLKTISTNGMSSSCRTYKLFAYRKYNHTEQLLYINNSVTDVINKM